MSSEKERLLQYASLCMGCMREKGQRLSCADCGYNESTAPSHPSYLRPRTLLNNEYIVGRALKQGGFGITYIAFDTNLEKKVAIKEYFPSTLAIRNHDSTKVIPLENRDDIFNRGLKSFERESKKLARFSNHPHIVNVHRAFQENGTGYIVMDFLDGGELSAYLEHTGGRISVKDAIQILLPILDALKALHKEHLFHRDVSPQNIMFDANRRPVLIDFGGAKYLIGQESHTVESICKPGYSPFEQYTSGQTNIGAWTDIYACGATFYRMITGDIPPSAPDRCVPDRPDRLKQPVDIAYLYQTLSNTTLRRLNEIILRSLSVKKEDRYQTVEEFKHAINALNEPDEAIVLKAGFQKNNNTIHQLPLPKKKKYAGLFRRCFAFSIDCVINLFIIVIGIGITLHKMPTIEGLFNEFHNIGIVVILLLVISNMLILSPILECLSSQATFGKMMFGIIVTNTNGKRATFFQTIIRNFIKLCPLLLLCWGILTKEISITISNITSLWTEYTQGTIDNIIGWIQINISFNKEQLLTWIHSHTQLDIYSFILLILLSCIGVIGFWSLRKRTLYDIFTGTQVILQ